MNLLSEETHIPLPIVKRNVLDLTEKGFITFTGGDTLRASDEQRLKITTFALREGGDVERVCKALGWKEFESLVALALYKHGFRVEQRFRFQGLGRKYEIDVLGLKKPLVLSIECKHWKRNWKAAVIKAANKQIRRTWTLVQSSEPTNRLGIARWEERKYIPLVLTLSDTSLKIFDGIAIIPIFQFNNFLNEMPTYIDKLTIF